MEPQAYSLVVRADAETLWAILQDLMRNPSRYENEVTLKKLSSTGDSTALRQIERGGRVHEETIEYHLDALMVELTCPSRHLTLIHQIVPMETRSMLNLAANHHPIDEDGGEADTTTIDLAALGQAIKTMAEKLSR